MDPVVDAVRRLGGVATRAELRSFVSKGRLRRAVAEGRVLRPRPGRYLLRDVDAARAVAHELSAVVSHRSAALAHGWKVKTLPPKPEITVPRGRKIAAEIRPRARVSSLIDPRDAAAGVTSPVRTVVDCARHLPFDEALAIADSALRSRRVAACDLATAARQVRGPGRPRVLRVLAHASGKAANPFESVLRAIALDVPGLAAVPQLQAGDFRVDLGDPHLRLVIEAESWEFHGTKDGLEKDVRRYTQLAREGWTVIRFLWDDVVNHPDQVRSAIADVVALCERATCCLECRGGMTP